MTNFVPIIVAFALFFAVFYGATKLLGYAFRGPKEQDETTSVEERDDANDE